MMPRNDLPPEYSARIARSGKAPDRERFVQPWSDGTLIRYLAHLRHQYAHMGFSRPESQEPISMETLFVERRLGMSSAAPEVGLTLVDLLEHGQRAVILGAPGSGRSTLLAWMIYQLTEPDPNEVNKRLGALVPIPINVEELDFTGEGRTVQAIVNQLRRQPFWYEGLDALLPDLIRRGQVLFLVDGIEELRQPVVSRDILRDALLDGMWRFPLCSWVITADSDSYSRDPLKEEIPESGPLPPSLASLPMAQDFDIPVWHLMPLDSLAVRRFIDGYQSLHHQTPAAIARAAKDLRMSLSRSLLGLDLSRSPSLLTLLSETHRRCGQLPIEDSELFTSLVESTASIIGRIPGSEAFPPEVLSVWMEAMGREAEIARFASSDHPGRHLPEVYLALTPPADLGSSLDRDWAAGLLRVLTLAATRKDPGDTSSRTLLDEALCVPGVLVGRGPDGLSFMRLDVQQILAGRSLGRVLEEGRDGTDEAKEALELLRGWFRRPDARPILIEVFRFLGQRPELAERLYKKLIGGRRRRTLGELDDLGPLTHALCRGLAGPLPDRVRRATEEFCDDAVRRWVEERGRVPLWASDLSPVASMPGLKALDLSGCRWIASIEALRELRSLQRLNLHGCSAIRDLSPLTRLIDLQWLDLRGCSGVESISSLAALQSLQWLDLGGCKGIRSLSALDGLDQLQALALHGCHEITDLSPLASMRSLKALVISDCPGVTDLSPLKGLRSGGQVWVRGSGVQEAPPALRWKVLGLG